MVLKLKMSQDTDIAGKEIQEPMVDQVTMTEPELSFFRVLFTFNKYSEFMANGLRYGG